MASVAICPHCYLQLVVPDGIEPDERVECPTCAKEFGLGQAVLRAIPEVVRRSPAAAPAESLPAESIVDEIVIDEVVEIDELVTTADEARETDVIEEIKARIEAEIAAKGLIPGTSSLLPLELPMDDTDDRVKFSTEIEPSSDDPTEWFRHAKTVPEIPAIELPELAEESATAGAAAIEAAESIEAIEETIEFSEPVEPRFSKPTVRTLAELMPPTNEPSEIEAAQGPSFDLPNVPLVPSNGSTIEFDSSMSFGPVAETEFELDDVDFESMPAEEAIADEQAAEEAAAESEPVFHEPKLAELPAAPFVLPAIPRARKKRSVVRTLVGVMAGGIVGTIAALYALLYLLGPDGDVLHIAQYFPSSVLPKSFGSNSMPIADTGSTPAPLRETVPEPGETTTENESANVPAGYVEETPTTPESVAADEPAGEERYDNEPAPLDEPAAEPIAEDATSAPSVPPLPLAGPKFTVNDLSTALEAGKEAQAGLMTGDLNDAAVRRTKGMSYAKLCDLAQALTFVDRSSPSIESDDAIEGADRLFKETLSDAHTRSEVARIAQIWIDSPHRGHGGFFLAGSLSGGQIAGEVYEYELATDAGDKLTLLMQEPLDPSVEGSHHPIGVVGTISDDPAREISGYKGPAKRAVWVTRAIPLD